MAKRSGWASARKIVFAKAVNGFRLSSLHGVELKCAERMIDRGELGSTLLPGGDRLVYKR